MNEVFTPRMTHLRLIEAEARIAEIERELAALRVIAEPLLKREAAQAKKASYMREYMAKKRAAEHAI